MGRYGRSRGNQRRGPARCDECRQPITWLRLRGSWRKFEPAPVDGRTHVGASAHAVEGKHAWPTLRELVEDLRVRREISTGAAEDEAYDMPWHAIHQCPPTTDHPVTPEGTTQ